MSNNQLSMLDNKVMFLLNQSMRIALEEQDPDVSIRKLLEFWGKELESDRTYIFEYLGGRVVSNTYEWCAPGIRPEIDGLQNIPEEVGNVWKVEFEKYGHALIKHVDDIKDSDPLLYEVLKPQELTSVITCPIYHKGELIGLYGVDNPPEDKMDKIVDALPVIGNFLDSLIIRRNLMNELETQSTVDPLTGMLNKRAMEQEIELIEKPQPCGVIFCDICGLKRVNDLQGHSEGDKLIMRAVKNFKDNFDSNRVFRIGGDEFVALEVGVTVEEIEAKIEALRKLAYETDAPIAIGYSWRRNAIDFYSMVDEADHNMYEDKKKYYSQQENK